MDYIPSLPQLNPV